MVLQTFITFSKGKTFIDGIVDVVIVVSQVAAGVTVGNVIILFEVVVLLYVMMARCGRGRKKGLGGLLK